MNCDNFSKEQELAEDTQFIQRVAAEVTQSCALPLAVPTERIPEFILQAAQWFWTYDDYALEERSYVIKNKDFCHGAGGAKENKIVQLPKQIMSVHIVSRSSHKALSGNMGDFSLERMMMDSYSMSQGLMSTENNGLGATGGFYNLMGVVAGLYEMSTFQKTLGHELTYNFNQYSHKLIVLGDLGPSDVYIQCMKRCRIQDLYDSYYFFRTVVCFVKRALATIYGTFEFTLPGGVTINVSDIKSDADSELDTIKEYFENNRACDYFFQPNTV